jgi:hypothetical protein
MNNVKASFVGKKSLNQVSDFEGQRWSKYFEESVSSSNNHSLSTSPLPSEG